MVVALLVLFIALFYWVVGLASAWVLSYFGVDVPWYACAAGVFLLSLIFGGQRG